MQLQCRDYLCICTSILIRAQCHYKKYYTFTCKLDRLDFAVTKSSRYCKRLKNIHFGSYTSSTPCPVFLFLFFVLSRKYWVLIFLIYFSTSPTAIIKAASMNIHLYTAYCNIKTCSYPYLAHQEH